MIGLTRVVYVLLCIVAGAIAGFGVCAILDRWVVMDGDFLLSLSMAGTAVVGCLFGVVTRKRPRLYIGLGAVFLLAGLVLLVLGRATMDPNPGWHNLGNALVALGGGCAAIVGLLILLLGLLACYLRRSRPVPAEITP